MARDKFISDNLYNMRERFKRNHAEHQSTPDIPGTNSGVPAESQVHSEISSEPASSTPVSGTSSSMPRLPNLNSGKGNNDNLRERRELEGRLLRDLSFINAENELIAQRKDALEHFRKLAESLLDELNQSDLSARQIDLLRIKYFQAYGRFEAITSQRNSNTPATPVQNSAAPSSWPIIVAISGAAVLISLTLVLLFGR